jgi:phosphate starvation-inducible protein PhoH
MRGRTLNHSFVILDEAQNTTPEQMKMFLTRLGFGSVLSLQAISRRSTYLVDSNLV